MRDPNRISGIIGRLERLWRERPDYRLGQLILNASGEDAPSRLYYLEDTELLDLLERLYGPR